MFTNVSPFTRILRSSHGKRLQAIPWETLLHIFSYCDQPTLASISLVSFGCWELAGPLLYEDVEINDLDGLASLFFIDALPSSPRLQQATSLLSRIRTLALNIQSWEQENEPFFQLHGFDRNDEDEQDFYDGTYEEPDLLVPHRLLLFVHQLRLDSVLLPDWTYLDFHQSNFLPLHLFPYLNPQTLTLNRPSRRSHWFGSIVAFSPTFMRKWTDLRRIEMSNTSITCAYGLDGYQECTLGLLWARAHSVFEEEGESKPPFELCLDFFAGKSAGGLEGALSEIRLDRRTAFQILLENAGVSKEMVGLVDLKMVVRVKKEEEELAMKQIRGLDEWMKAVVTLEAV
ncbi:hypothetical protein BDY24DRAFT_418402 [Mrakia frigida]|uniref:F-box protein n=1 Tax=Mrakia frigida TaxID=29902 RepID=UPI003FCC1775